MSNVLSFRGQPHPARRATDRGATVDGAEFPILDRDGDIVRADRRIPESPQSNIEVEWLPVAEIRL